MRVVITDVSVFFDLFELNVLAPFFDLEWEINTTDFVYNEIVHEEQIREFERFERTKQLKIIKVTSEEVDEIRLLELRRPNKSFPDKTALWHAKKRSCTLLTCDSVLRAEAEHLKIEVHGSIWVLLQLLESDLITKEKAIALLEKLKLINARLPRQEIDQIIARIKKSEADGV